MTVKMHDWQQRGRINVAKGLLNFIVVNQIIEDHKYSL